MNNGGVYVADVLQAIEIVRAERASHRRGFGGGKASLSAFDHLIRAPLSVAASELL
jgi:hypothetical protein